MQLYCFVVIRDYYYYYPGDANTHKRARASKAVFLFHFVRMASNAVPITSVSDIEKSSLNQSRLNKANANREQ